MNNIIKAIQEGFERIKPIQFPTEYECKSCYRISDNNTCNIFPWCKDGMSVVNSTITIKYMKWL